MEISTQTINKDRNQSSSSSLQNTKISRPNLPKVYHRDRLHQELKRSQNCSLIWVSSPAGSGKTTLISDFLQREKLNHLWFEVDDNDCDLATFFHYLNKALDLSTDKRCESSNLPKYGPEYESSPSSFIREYFDVLFSCLPRPSVIVFDNLHQLPKHSSLLSAFNHLISKIPNHIQFIIISRHNPPDWFPRLQINRVAKSLDWDDIRFNQEESIGVIKLMQQQSETKILTKRYKFLHEISKGWIASLIMLLLVIDGKNTDISRLKDITEDYLFDYFSNEFFQQADKTEQSFLLKTAHLPFLTDNLLSIYLDETETSPILEELYQRNFLITKHYQSGKQETYQYHPLFHSFLLDLSTTMLPDKERKALNCRAAGVLLECGDDEAAIEKYLEIKEWKSALTIILSKAHTLLAQGRIRTLKRWLEKTPQRLLHNMAWGNYWQGICAMSDLNIQTERYFNQAYIQFKTQKDITGMYLTLAAAIENAWLQQRDHHKIDDWLQHYDELVQEHIHFPTDEIEARVISMVLMGMYWRQPDHPKAHETLNRAEELWQSDLPAHLRLQLGTAIGFYISGTDRLISWYKAVKTYAPDEDEIKIASMEYLHLLLYLAFGECFSGNYEISSKYIQRGLQLSENSGLKLFDPLFLSVAIYNNLLTTDTVNADYNLERMRQKLAQSSPSLDLAHYQTLLSWRALLENDPHDAVKSARAAVATAESTGAIYAIGRCYYGLAHALFETGAYEEALNCLAQSRLSWGGSTHQQLLYDSDFSEAAFHLLMGDIAQAKDLLEKVLRQGVSQGWGVPLWSRPKLLEPLFRLALENNLQTQFVKQLIQQTELIPQKPALIPDDWPMAVRVYTLGKFSLLINGNILNTSKKSAHRPLQLLKAIVAYGSKGVSQEKLMDSLWPDAQGDTVVTSFNTTLHRLRKLIGVSKAIVLKDSRIYLNERYIWVDLVALKHLFLKAEQEISSQSPDITLINLYWSKVRKLYRGNFLETDSSEPWTVGISETIHNRLNRLIISLGALWEKEEMHDQAVEGYQFGLEVDYLAEILYQKIMQVYISQGRYAEAVLTYEHCRKNLMVSLKIMPGPQTVKLYKSIPVSNIEKAG